VTWARLPYLQGGLIGGTDEHDGCEGKGQGEGEVNGEGFGGEAVDNGVEGLMGCNGMRSEGGRCGID
jgi:hypothetical protein